MPPDDPTPAPGPDPTPAPTPSPSPDPAPADARFVPLERFERVTGEKYEAIRKAEAATQRAAELESRMAQYEAARVTATPQPTPSPNPSPAPAPALTQVELDRLAQVRAEQMRFAERCNEDVAAGRKKFADFDTKIAALTAVAPTSDAQGRPMLPKSLIEAALATGRGHEVLYSLANDSSEADRVMSLSDPVRQAVEVTRLADKLAATAQAEGDDPAKLAEAARRASEAPKPIRPVVGGARALSVKDMSLDDPNLPIEEFMRRRDEEAGRSRRPNGRFR